jgi:hypothetical protein
MHIGRDSHNPDILGSWDDLVRFQLVIAERWLERGNKAKDTFAKFSFYFTGFNAIYFLWRKIDNLDYVSEGKHSEGKHIENLLNKFDEAKAREILDKIGISVDYFSKRRPIQRMDRRSSKALYMGEESEGGRWRKKLQDNNLPPSERLVAMGQILYLVRSNLVHGSKAESGDDLNIIQKSIEPLKVFLTEAVSWTKEQCLKER